ncbi:MAG: alpha-amylase family glycosyl hydrolase [Myxococcales bacterium]
MSHPQLLQINTLVLLGELGHTLGRPATLDDLPDALIESLARDGFDWLWLLGVWRASPASRQVSRNQPDWRRGFRRDLPDLLEEDISGSPYAIQGYSVRPEFGGDKALERVRARLARAGVRLMLDFVPNHVSLDHPWVAEHPEFLVEGDAQAMAEAPQNYISLETARGPRVLAHGRDPYFPGWPDTLQLNYRHAGLRAAMIEQLRSVARRCDGVRCDMAMLILPDVFQRTWGAASLPRDGTAPVDSPFWPEAIAQVRRERPGFAFMAEVYWDLEFALQQQGFDFTYDKRLYDRLREGAARPVRDHLRAAPDYQRRSARFLENHDEPRAAATFPWEVHRAAAVISFLVPGLRFFHEGQFEGRRHHVSMHLARRPAEAPDPEVQSFYRRLLACLRRPEVREGEWRLCECRPAWEGNGTWDQFIAFTWQGPKGGQLLVVVNDGPVQAQCYLAPGLPDLSGRKVALKDLMGEARYERAGDELAGAGLYLDMGPWAYSVFEVAPSR